MLNFELYNPTKLIFGKDQYDKLRTEIPLNAKILMTYGGGSIMNNGVYNQVISALKGFNITEFRNSFRIIILSFWRRIISVPRLYNSVFNPRLYFHEPAIVSVPRFSFLV